MRLDIVLNMIQMNLIYAQNVNLDIDQIKDLFLNVWNAEEEIVQDAKQKKEKKERKKKRQKYVLLVIILLNMIHNKMNVFQCKEINKHQSLKIVKYMIIIKEFAYNVKIKTIKNHSV